MKVIQEPAIEFTCESCGAVNQGRTEEFLPQHTMPPTWIATCAFCNCKTLCAPEPLIAKLVGSWL